MPDKPSKPKHAAMYVIDLKAGNHSYAFVEGVGECRENFMHLVESLESGEVDGIIVYKAEYLFIDTSPMWMEKFIAVVKRRGIIIADASTNREADVPSQSCTVCAISLQ
jgi:hypothetical protein